MQVSVIIPTFNLEKYLPVCLDSLLAQDLPASDFEIILVDDASTDGTRQVIETYQHRRPGIRLIARARNGGPGPARNDGLDAACGTYVLFVDGDDYLAPQALSTLVRHAKENSADAVAFSYDLVDTLGAVPYARRKDLDLLPLDRNERIRLFLRGDLDGSVIFTFLRRELLQEHSIRFPVGLHEDIPVIFQVYYHCRVLCKLPQILYHKICRPGSIVNTQTERHIDDILAAVESNYHWLVAQNLDPERRLWQHHLRGYIGVISGLLSKIVLYFPGDPKRRSIQYRYLYRRMAKSLDLEHLDYLPQSRMDHHFFFFLASFRNGDDDEVARETFERQAISIGILSPDSFLRTTQAVLDGVSGN